MNVLRVIVLLLVCLLLPLRGVVAATMPCEAMAPASELAAVAGHAHHAQADAGSDAAAPVTAADTAAEALADADGCGDCAHDDGAGGDSCHICASGCHAVALGTTLPALNALPSAAALFPALRVPAPDFALDGPERPPRSR